MAHVTFVTPPAFLAFEDVRKPRQNDQGEARYGVCLVFDREAQEDPLWKSLAAEVQAQAAVLAREVRKKTVKTPIQPADGTKDDGSYWPGNGEGHVLFRATTKRGPEDPEWPLVLAGPDNKPVRASAFYRGCRVRARVHVYSRNDPKNPCVSLGLDAVQFLADGERVGSGPSGFEDAPPVAGTNQPRQAAPPERSRAFGDGSDGAGPEERPPERGYLGDMDADQTPF